MAYFAHNQEQSAPYQPQPMPPAIAQAIVDVMGAVGKLVKSDTNEHGRYRYASVDVFYEALAPCLAAAGLIIKPVKVGDARQFEAPGKEGKVRRMLKLKFKFRLIHASGAMWCDDEDVREVDVEASGSQAYGAAESYVLKTFERSLFQIPTGEEDADAQEKLETEQRKATVKAQQVARETKEENFILDVGNGIEPVPDSKVEEAMRAAANAIKDVQAFDAWMSRNEHGRASFHAAHKNRNIALKKELVAIREKLVMREDQRALV